MRPLQGVAADRTRPAIVEANEDKIVYEIMFDLPEAGLPAPASDLPLGDNSNDMIIPPIMPDNMNILVGDSSRYPT